MAPEIPEEVSAAELDRTVRARLRTLSRENADVVARHLVMAGRLLDIDPEQAYLHAQEAVRRAGRVDVVREAAALTAYATARYAEALRELRTVRRLRGSSEHIALMADCERGLGRPERALRLGEEAEGLDLPVEVRAELAVVLSGARLDMDQPEAALLALEVPAAREAPEPWRSRVRVARADALRAAGRPEDAEREIAAIDPRHLDEVTGEAPGDTVVVIDLAEEAVDATNGADGGDADGARASEDRAGGVGEGSAGAGEEEVP